MKRTDEYRMIILALEFSSPRRSVAVLQSDAPDVAPTILGVSSDEGLKPAKPLQLVEIVLGLTRVEREDIECVVVGLGPGSYNGIRSAIAVAQGWQLARPVRLLGMSTADCLAAQAQARSWLGRVQVLIDAQRNEFYVAAYQIDAEGWRIIEPLRLATMKDVCAPALEDLERSGSPPNSDADSELSSPILIGPEVDRWFAEGRVLWPDAGVMGQMARGRSDFVSGEKLEPIYLRQTTFVKAPPPRVL